MNQANPLPAELSAQLSALSPTQLAWLSGYCWAQSQGAAAPLPEVSAGRPAPAARRVTVLSASQTGNARRVADAESIDIRTYRVIYDALNDVKDAMSGMLAPKYKEVVQGKVEIRQVMKFSKALVAGSYVLEGKITNSSKIRILRDNIVAFDGELDSLRRFKDDVKEVAAGYECGITIKDYRDFQEGDIIEAYTMEEIETSITEANKEAAKKRDQQEQTKKDAPAEGDA